MSVYRYSYVDLHQLFSSDIVCSGEDLVCCNDVMMRRDSAQEARDCRGTSVEIIHGIEKFWKHRG